MSFSYWTAFIDLIEEETRGKYETEFFLFCCVFSQDMLETNDSISNNQPGMRDLYEGDDKIHNK